VNPYAACATLILLVATHYFAYTAGQDNVHAKSDKAVIIEMENTQKEMTAYISKLQKAEDERDKQNDIIHHLTGDLARVRIKGICGSTVPGLSKAGTDQDGRAGLLSEKADRAFEELQRGDNADFARCDQLNIDAIRANAEAH